MCGETTIGFLSKYPLLMLSSKAYTHKHRKENHVKFKPSTVHTPGYDRINTTHLHGDCPPGRWLWALTTSTYNDKTHRATSHHIRHTIYIVHTSIRWTFSPHYKHSPSVPIHTPRRRLTIPFLELHIATPAPSERAITKLLSHRIRSLPPMKSEQQQLKIMVNDSAYMERWW